MDQTGGMLDLAITGRAISWCKTPSGERYTRNGHFKLDDQGSLVTTEGYQVQATAASSRFNRRRGDLQSRGRRHAEHQSPTSRKAARRRLRR